MILMGENLIYTNQYKQNLRITIILDNGIQKTVQSVHLIL